MDDCSNADTRKAGECSFSICKGQAAGGCELCRTNLILNIEGCSCYEFQSEYEADFFIRGNTGQSNFHENFKKKNEKQSITGGNCYKTRTSFWDEIKDIRWESGSSSCNATTRKPIVKSDIDDLMQQSNITICNDPSRGVFDFHVKIFDKNGKFIVRSVSLLCYQE